MPHANNVVRTNRPTWRTRRWGWNTIELIRNCLPRITTWIFGVPFDHLSVVVAYFCLSVRSYNVNEPDDVYYRILRFITIFISNEEISKVSWRALVGGISNFANFFIVPSDKTDKTSYVSYTYVILMFCTYNWQIQLEPRLLGCLLLRRVWLTLSVITDQYPVTGLFYFDQAIRINKSTTVLLILAFIANFILSTHQI